MRSRRSHESIFTGSRLVVPERRTTCPRISGSLGRCCLHGGSNEIGRCDAVSIRPVQPLRQRRAAATLPTLFGTDAAASSCLTRICGARSAAIAPVLRNHHDSQRGAEHASQRQEAGKVKSPPTYSMEMESGNHAVIVVRRSPVGKWVKGRGIMSSLRSLICCWVSFRTDRIWR